MISFWRRIGEPYTQIGTPLRAFASYSGACMRILPLTRPLGGAWSQYLLGRGVLSGMRETIVRTFPKSSSHPETPRGVHMLGELAIFLAAGYRGAFLPSAKSPAGHGTPAYKGARTRQNGSVAEFRGLPKTLSKLENYGSLSKTY
jgi:hypothetical protein